MSLQHKPKTNLWQFDEIDLKGQTKGHQYKT